MRPTKKSTVSNTNRHPLIAVVRWALALVVVAAVLLSASDLLACPTCKDGLAENDPASSAMAAGYFYSILFMMAMPFVIIGTFGGAAYLSIKRARDVPQNKGQQKDGQQAIEVDDPDQPFA